MMNDKMKSLTKRLVDELVETVPPTMIDEALTQIMDAALLRLDQKLGVPYSELCRAEVIHQMSMHEGRYHVTLS